MRFVLASLLVSAVVLAAAAAPAAASPSVQYGVQDDAWLLYGPGTLDSRLALLDRLGPDLVRLTLRWDEIAPTRPSNPRNPGDPAYHWAQYDALLDGLRAHHVGALLTLLGTPRWANGGGKPNRPPTSKWSLANFAYAASRRYPWVHRWTIWNEPNRRIFLLPTSPRLYTQRLLDPAYHALKAASRANVVAGGVTAPRKGPSGVSPVAWIRSMRRFHARLDAYAANPYPLRPRETPTSGGCPRCAEFTMATLPKLIAEVKRDFGAHTRIWLTEYGYNSKPPSTWLGVSNAKQARFVSVAARRVYAAPRVDVLIHFLIRDEPDASTWTSGFFTSHGSAKPSLHAYPFPTVQVSRHGLRTVLWGQVRPRLGAQPFRLQRWAGRRWVWVGGTHRTSRHGYWRRVVRAGRHARLRVYSPRDHAYGSVVVVA